MNLWDELQPLAEELETARELVVEAARKQVGKNDHGGATELVDAVDELDKVQMALGLKTAQLLLKRGQAKGVEVDEPDIPSFLAQHPPAAPVIPPGAKLGPWSKKERATE